MMYRDNYAVAVMMDGKVQKEDKDGAAVLPFETEYQIRLKNKNRKKAVADVFIDGRIAAKGIVIDACGTVDLERFIADGNLSSGNRFKIVKANDGRVEQPGEAENGLVHVNFYPEKDKPVVKVIEEHKTVIHDHYSHSGWCHHNCCRQCCLWCQPHYHSNAFYTGGPVYGSNIRTMDAGHISSKSFSAETVNLTGTGNGGGTSGAVYAAMNQVAEDAATVEGSLSTQSFTHTYVDVDYDKCTTLQIKLKGVKSAFVTCECGFKRKQEKFCPQCGKKLIIEVTA